MKHYESDNPDGMRRWVYVEIVDEDLFEKYVNTEVDHALRHGMSKKATVALRDILWYFTPRVRIMIEHTIMEDRVTKANEATCAVASDDGKKEPGKLKRFGRRVLPFLASLGGGAGHAINSLISDDPLFIELSRRLGEGLVNHGIGYVIELLPGDYRGCASDQQSMCCGWQ